MHHVSLLFYKRSNWLMSMIAICMLAGCGSKTNPIQSVTGKITLDGKPLTEGIVNFVSAGGFAATSAVKDGAFSISRSQYGSGIPLGEYKVAVQAPPPPDPLAKPSPTPASTVQIPKKYRDPATSGLTAKVDKAAKPMEFVLLSK